jgi:hypothetical protein
MNLTTGADSRELLDRVCELFIIGIVNREGVVDAVLHRMRLAHTQVCPALQYLEAIAPLTAISMSASSKTMNGALPRNSSGNFFTVLAHCCTNSLP